MISSARAAPPIALALAALACATSTTDARRTGTPPADAMGGSSGGTGAGGGATGAGGSASAPDGTGGDADATCNVALADPALEAEVRAALRVPMGTISADARALLTSLAVVGVGSLSGLECFGALRTLRLRRGAADDLSPLAGLSALEELDVSDHPVIDVSPLSGLGSLRRLTITVAPLSDIEPLRSLPLLEWLTLRETEIADLGPLAGHRHLQWLDVADTAVTSIAPLAAVTSLSFLAVSGTAVTDLAPIGFPPGEGPYCPEIRASSVTFGQDTLDRVIPTLCGRGWSLTWNAPGQPQERCGPGCRI